MKHSEIRYCVFEPDGKVNLNYAPTLLRKEMVDSFGENVSGKLWESAKLYGWKIKKVKLTVESI